tara:strand:+ start:776 stop:2200 length:1425 start_codon:yes stop_codon:yes gene_type:complete
MLSKLRKFKESKFAIVLVAMIAIPFVFWGMGGTFSSGNTNSIVKINNYNISTQDFTDHLSSENLNEKYIRENIENGILEELLSELIMNKLIEIEIKDLGVFISEKSLANKIKKQKIFFDESNNFSRIKYEKFLLQKFTSAGHYEMKFKNVELKKKLFNYIDGGIKSPYFIANQNYINENKNVQILYLNLNNVYKNSFSNNEINKYVKKNSKSLERELVDISYIKLNPENLTQLNEFSNEFYKIIDDIEDSIINGDTINKILNRYNLAPNINKNYYLIKNEDNEILKEIYLNREKDKLNIVDKNDHFLLYEISNAQKLLPKIDDINFLEQVKESMLLDEKTQLHKKLIEQIQNKSINDDTFNKLVDNKDLIKAANLDSTNDETLFKKDSVELIFSLPKNQFLLISDKQNNIHLAKINEIILKKLNVNSNEMKKYSKISNNKIKNKLYNTYDLYLNTKYEININQNTLERVKNYFK